MHPTSRLKASFLMIYRMLHLLLLDEDEEDEDFLDPEDRLELLPPPSPLDLSDLDGFGG